MNENKLEELKSVYCHALDKFSLYDLRIYGRELNLTDPTKMNKGEIVPLIVAVLLGEVTPAGRNNRGAPVKNKTVNPDILKTVEDLKRRYLYKEKENGAGSLEESNSGDFMEVPSRLVFGSDDTQEEHWTEQVNKTVVRGQLQVLNDVSRLLPLDCGVEEEPIVVPVELVGEHGLREGDVVACHTVKVKNVSVVKEILTVNDTQLMFLKREKFEESEVCYPYKTVPFLSEKASSVSAKYIEWLLPLYQGQRGVILSSPKAGKTELLYALTTSALNASREVKVLALLTAQSPENVWKFRNVIPEDQLVYTTYDDSPEKQVFAAEFILNRAKRFVECGKNVVLFVDSYSSLARAYNETEASAGGKVLAGGLESKTLQYMRRFLGSARCFKQDGSLTLLGTVACDTGNPFDELLALELSNLANHQIYLSEALSAKRVYPAIDLPKSFTRPGGISHHEKSEQVYQQACREFLPTRGEESLYKTLESSDHFSDFLDKIGAKI